MRVLDEYPKGYVGRTGDKGISAAAGSCPSLLPANNDVLRLSCEDADGFRKFVGWYFGEELLDSKPTGVDALSVGVVVAELNRPGF